MVDRKGLTPYLTAMSLLPIVNIPDPILRTRSKPVERFDEPFQKFLDDLADTMYDAPGIGIAAIQVGEPLRVFVVDCTERSKKEEESEDGKPIRKSESAAETEDEEEERNPIFLINPEIVSFSEERKVYEEGCLSIPDYFADVERPSDCTIKFLDRHGKEQVMDAGGLESVCIQHEYDHLNGVLFVDYISKLKRDMVIRKFTKMAKQNGTKFIG